MKAIFETSNGKLPMVIRFVPENDTDQADARFLAENIKDVKMNFRGFEYLKPDVSFYVYHPSSGRD